MAGRNSRIPAYDFDLWRSTVDSERYTEQCDEAGNLIGSRYHVFGTDRLYNIEKKKRVVEGTFEFTVVSILLDPDEDIWQVEKQGILWDVHAADEEWNRTWSVDATWVSDGAPEQPFLTQYRGVEPSEFEAVCDYLRAGTVRALLPSSASCRKAHGPSGPAANPEDRHECPWERPPRPGYPHS